MGRIENTEFHEFILSNACLAVSGLIFMIDFLHCLKNATCSGKFHNSFPAPIYGRKKSDSQLFSKPYLFDDELWICVPLFKNPWSISNNLRTWKFCLFYDVENCCIRGLIHKIFRFDACLPEKSGRRIGDCFGCLLLQHKTSS